MDLITKSVVAALKAGMVDGLSQSHQNPAAAKAYQSLKTVLGQKFGVDSDLLEAIQQLERKPQSAGYQEVLKEEVAAVRADQDSELLAITESLLAELEPKAAGGRSTLPVQRPAHTSYFIGRESEVAQLLLKLQPGQIVALSGPGGIGKTALVAAILSKLAPDDKPPGLFPDGVIYHDFYNQPRVDIALAQIVRAFGGAPMPTAYDAAERVLAKRRALLVLDDVDQADDLPGLLAMRGQCGVLMTAPKGAASQVVGAIQHNIAPLSLDHAAMLLETWSENALLDKTVNLRICDLLGRSPLSLRLAGRYLAAKRKSPASYLAWLETTALAKMELSQRQEESVRLLIEYNLTHMSELAQQTLSIAGLLSLVPFEERAAVKALTTESAPGFLSTLKGIFNHRPHKKKPEIIPAIRELVLYGLLWWTGQRPEVSHPLIHAYARRRLPPTPKMVRQLAIYYTSLVWKQSSLGSAGYPRLDANRLHFMRVLNECLEREDWEVAHALATALEDYLDQQGYWIERVMVNEAGLVAAWQLGRPSEGAWLGNLGDTYRAMGHARWAIEHFKKALETARRVGDPYNEANSLGNLGLAYRDLGQIEQARQYLQQAFIIFNRVNSSSADLVQDWLRELEAWQEE